jgi:hypothetical protein
MRANSLGLLSESLFNFRGNGVLLMTTTELAFFMLVPPRQTRVPLDRIRAVDNPRWWRYKSVAYKLLAVRFEDGAGALDGIAFWVDDLPGWTSALRSAAGLD